MQSHKTHLNTYKSASLIKHNRLGTIFLSFSTFCKQTKKRLLWVTSCVRGKIDGLVCSTHTPGVGWHSIKPPALCYSKQLLVDYWESMTMSGHKPRLVYSRETCGGASTCGHQLYKGTYTTEHKEKKVFTVLNNRFCSYLTRLLLGNEIGVPHALMSERYCLASRVNI